MLVGKFSKTIMQYSRKILNEDCMRSSGTYFGLVPLKRTFELLKKTIGHF